MDSYIELEKWKKAKKEASKLIRKKKLYKDVRFMMALRDILHETIIEKTKDND